MKTAKITITFCLIFFSLQLIAQENTTAKDHQYRRRDGIWFTPSGANEINGITLGIFTFTDDSLKLNGLDIELNPLSLMVPLAIVPGLILIPFQKKEVDTKKKDKFPVSTDSDIFISGLSIGAMCPLGENNIKGVAMYALFARGQQVDGMSFSGLMNIFYNYNGVLIAGIRNQTTTGKGLQIGLFNSCRDCKGVQIGLLNKMGKRMLPFVNVRL